LTNPESVDIFDKVRNKLSKHKYSWIVRLMENKPLNGQPEKLEYYSITSAANPKYKLWKSLLDSRGIKRSGMCLVSGSKTSHEIKRLHPEKIRGWIFNNRSEFQSAIVSSDIPVYILSSQLYRELDVFGTGYPLLLTALPEIYDFEKCGDEHDVVLLLPFQNPSNVGAVIRSAAAFGFHAIVLLTEAALPFHPQSIRAGGTAIFEVSYYKGPSINELETLQFPVVALSSGGLPIDSFSFPDRFALLPGMEGPGLPDDLSADNTVSIPMEPHIESLNAAVATSIALYEIRKAKKQ